MRTRSTRQDEIDAALAELDGVIDQERQFSTWTNDYVPGPYWQGMLDWSDQVKPVVEILADIQAARESYDAEHPE